MLIVLIIGGTFFHGVWGASLEKGYKLAAVYSYVNPIEIPYPREGHTED